jgi:ribosomal protein L9
MSSAVAAAASHLVRRAFVRPRRPAPPPVRVGKRVQVVLRGAFDPLGLPGQEVPVAPGYARNYLIPKGIAAYATPENRAQYLVEYEPVRARALDGERVQRLLRARVAQFTLPLYRASKDGTALYNSISSEDVVVQMNEGPLRSLGVKQANVRVAPRDGAPPRPLREGDIATVGEHTVEIEMVRSSPGLWCPLKVRVIEA